MNDPEEGLRLFNTSTALSKFYLNPKNDLTFIKSNGLEYSVYASSFTLKIDRLDLWRAYGGDGSGYCLVTPLKAFNQDVKTAHRSFLPSNYVERAEDAGNNALSDLTEILLKNKVSPFGFSLYKIKYSDEEVNATSIKLEGSLSPLVDFKMKKTDLSPLVDRVVTMMTAELLHLYKNKEYASEAEARILKILPIDSDELNLDASNPPKLFNKSNSVLFEIPQSSVVVGPKVSDKTAAVLHIKHRLAKKGLLRHSNVLISDVKYR
ncbi:DUF2971 domain-containing protein [Gallaecimonas kandeliae]|uniref:DUF2971 domain-containing protein n=1 Tax=Gallaecimonas kandeliae TaxID=3029055 RepID=UPI002648F6F5|nr:DUF2971 domain-containing protein [Gallaecimonas kandeliae]WKE66665.1 DUF2971 domain-containing protein [Gallaecimonas kandeliae]